MSRMVTHATRADAYESSSTSGDVVPAVVELEAALLRLVRSHRDGAGCEPGHGRLAPDSPPLSAEGYEGATDQAGKRHLRPDL